MPEIKRSPNTRTRALVAACLFALSTCAAARAAQRPAWEARLDGEVRFYQQTELGVVVAGTDSSLYAIDGESGDVLWRRRGARFDEEDIAPVPGTDILLLSYEQKDRTRLEAADVLTGRTLWQSDKVKGAVLQSAVDADAGLLAAVFVRDARERAREGFKRKPTVHVFELATGRELWKYDLESEIELMPSEWREDDRKVAYTLHNYRAPAFLDGRLYLFYEGVTSLDAREGREGKQREKFKVNEDGLALTEADPLADDRFIYTSGRGRVRAVSRTTGDTSWEAKDLGLTPEMLLLGGVLYVRTGGEFARLKDGELAARGSYGVSAIDAATGKVLWRFKGADKGITNIAVPDPATILVADCDDLIALDARTGKRRAKVSHHVERAAFLVVNERGEAVVGGRSEVAAFDASASGAERVAEVWRAKHEPPGRGLLRTVTAIAARAASLYFRYGGVASTAFRGARLARGLGALRWSGLAAQLSMPDFAALAADAARDQVSARIATYGIASRARGVVSAATRARGSSSAAQLGAARLPRPSREGLEESLLDRIDPANQLERLSRFLWRRQRLAALRGQWMYFYTDLRGGNGLAGVNLNTGETARAVRLSDPDARFISDEVFDLLYTAKGERLQAYALNARD
ncbi:MAG TPA: PQQ-binding-like beta-propeller repeat protein [Pyrinomonadaceae bacterium]|nr:PQQ-binding-like beta-propeller repeat protein [Pyrinomonadaceae bacterium]